MTKLIKFLREELEEVAGARVFTMSGISGDGVTHVLRALRAEIEDERLRRRKEENAEADADEESGGWQP